MGNVIKVIYFKQLDFPLAKFCVNNVDGKVDTTKIHAHAYAKSIQEN